MTEGSSYQPVKFHPHGYSSHGNGLGFVVGAVAGGLDGGEHEEGAVAGEDVCYEALVGVWGGQPVVVVLEQRGCAPMRLPDVGCE